MILNPLERYGFATVLRGSGDGGGSGGDGGAGAEASAVGSNAGNTAVDAAAVGAPGVGGVSAGASETGGAVGGPGGMADASTGQGPGPGTGDGGTLFSPTVPGISNPSTPTSPAPTEASVTPRRRYKSVVQSTSPLGVQTTLF